MWPCRFLAVGRPCRTRTRYARRAAGGAGLPFTAATGPPSAAAPCLAAASTLRGAGRSVASRTRRRRAPACARVSRPGSAVWVSGAGGLDRSDGRLDVKLVVTDLSYLDSRTRIFKLLFDF